MWPWPTDWTHRTESAPGVAWPAQENCQPPDRTPALRRTPQRDAPADPVPAWPLRLLRRHSAGAAAHTDRRAGRGRGMTLRWTRKLQITNQSKVMDED